MAVASPATSSLYNLDAVIRLFRASFGTNVQRRGEDAEVSTPMFREEPASCLKVVHLAQFADARAHIGVVTAVVVKRRPKSGQLVFIENDGVGQLIEQSVFS
jgi:hypothetical protein